MVRNFFAFATAALTLLGFALLARISLGGFFAYSVWVYTSDPLLPLFTGLACLFFALAGIAAVLFLRLANTRYEILEGGLILRLGGKPILLPHTAIDWVRPLSDFKDELPLPKSRIPGYIFGKMNIKSLGLTHFGATDKNTLIIIVSGKHSYVISPSDKQGFLQAFRQNAERFPLHDLYDPAIHPRETWKMIFGQASARWLIIVGLLLVILLWVFAAWIVSRQTMVSWVSLEQVPSSQLYLLAIQGSLIWLFDFAAAYWVYRKPGVPKQAAHWLWGMGVIAPFILGAAMLLMSV